MILRHRVSRNAIALIVIQLTNYFVPLLVLPYLTRILNVETFGVVVITLSVIQLAYVITDYGFSLSATYAIANLNSDKYAIAKIIGSIFIIKIPLYILASLGVIIYARSSGYVKYEDFFILGLLAIFAQTFQPIWFFQGIEKMKRVTYYLVTTKIVYALWIFVFVTTEEGAKLVILGWGVAQLLGMVISIYQIYAEKYWISFPSYRGIIAVLNEGASFFMSRVAVSILTSASTMIIGTFCGPAQAAQFSICEQLYKAGQNVTSPINQALFPFMTKEKRFDYLVKIVGVISVILVIICSIAVFYSAELLTLIFGQNYVVAKPILIVFLVTIVVNYISVSFGYPAFAAIDRVEFANYSVILGSLLHCALLYYLFYFNQLSALNVALAILVTETAISLIRLSRIKYFKKIGV